MIQSLRENRTPAFMLYKGTSSLVPEIQKLISEFRLLHTLNHRVKSARIWSYSGPHFPAFGLNRERCYSVRMWENEDQNISEYGHFLRS